jgi:pyruvate/2-oxoglutarate dehydrogenase complex dihydrolipoamide acyltransferase (E2) component
MPPGRSGPRKDGEGAISEQEYNGYAVDRSGQSEGDSPDLVLDVPTLKVDELDLEVEDLRAHVSLSAELADFVKVNVGIDAYLDKVKLGIKGVEAQVSLKVRLERVLGTLERALASIDRNPQILGGSSQGSSKVVEGTGRDASQATSGGVTDAAPGESDSVEAEDTGEVDATDAARRKASQLGVKLSEVRGTGSNGRILIKDVERTARQSLA